MHRLSLVKKSLVHYLMFLYKSRTKRKHKNPMTFPRLRLPLPKKSRLILKCRNWEIHRRGEGSKTHIPNIQKDTFKQSTRISWSFWGNRWNTLTQLRVEICFTRMIEHLQSSQNREIVYKLKPNNRVIMPAKSTLKLSWMNSLSKTQNWQWARSAA